MPDVEYAFLQIYHVAELIDESPVDEALHRVVRTMRRESWQNLAGKSMLSVMRISVGCYHKRTAEAPSKPCDETAERERRMSLDDWARVNYAQFSLRYMICAVVG